MKCNTQLNRAYRYNFKSVNNNVEFSYGNHMKAGGASNSSVM